MNQLIDLRRRLALAILGPGAALLVCIGLGTWIGAVDISFPEVLRGIWTCLWPYADQDSLSGAVWSLRFPRVLLASVIGAVLAAGGAALQGLLGNPLAEPYTVGVSSGCVLGASVAVAYGLDAAAGTYAVPLAAFVTGVSAVSLVFLFARRAGSLDVNTFLLAGIIVGSLFWAIATFVLSARREDVARIFLWLAGTFPGDYPWAYLGMAWKAGLLVLAGLLWFARDLNAFALGEEPARQLGVDPEKLKLWVVALVTLGTAACVSAVGVIGFVGLIVPHGMRRVFGADHRTLIVSSALGGACLLVLADVVARSAVAPRELPVGVVTAILGAPVFLAILWRRSS